MKAKNVWMFLLLLATCLVGSSVFCSCSEEVHDYVDLGLPSGTLWATCNVGANSPEEYGNYFAWGETEPKNDYSWSTYKYCKGSSSTLTKYCAHSSWGTVDNKTELEPSDDAATVNWGSGWQMPSYKQYDELINSSYTTTTWTTLNGVYGRKITSKSNGNSIFLPAAGSHRDTSLYDAGYLGDYWSRSLDRYTDDFAYGLCFFSSSINRLYSKRYVGQSVRPVRVQKEEVFAVAGIELNKTELILVPKSFAQLTTTIRPWYAMNKNLKWESNNKSIATVDETGKVTAIAGGICAIICSATDGSGVKAECEITVYVDNEDNSGTIDGRDYVDLGLPSGTLWATCNVGALSLEEYGDYFAWGETKPKNDYSWSTYKYCNGRDDIMTKYYISRDSALVDNNTELETMDDAATVNWGSDWQMPSYEQFDELIVGYYTTTAWKTLNGVNGYEITSIKNGNSIFLPAAGYRKDTSLCNAGNYSNHWSRSLSSNYSNSAYGLCFSSHIDTDYYCRYYGHVVRPVRVQRNNESSVAGIELNKTELILVPKSYARLTTTIFPWYATNKNLKWESNNNSIATVDETGKVTAVAVGTCTIACSATDGSGIKAECKITVYVDNEDNSGAIDGRDYVDLGLPSGTLWATCNVGANSPDEYGDYFAWGEMQEKRDYSCNTYKYGGEYSVTKYCTNSECGTVDFNSELETMDDAATVNWGSGWQMPSYEQFDELIADYYTTTIRTTMNGVYGRKITSKSNGNSIFLPAAGYRDGTSLNDAGRCGYYWSRSLSEISSCHAYSLYFIPSCNDIGNIFRYYGQSVRPVRVKK